MEHEIDESSPSAASKEDPFPEKPAESTSPATPNAAEEKK
jgi:hypothetical protein